VEGSVELLPVFDNMYFDANGIIHTCSHPNDEDVSTRLSMEEMVTGMMAYMNKMVHIIRPRKMLFIAVDGCAPRAKMNQQRSRRFASARDAKLKREEAMRKGELSEQDAATMFDSNVITPGTEFMAELSRHFEFFLRKKVKEDPTWAGLQIVYSGHDVPGEGEHKIMDYIRHTRMQPDYDANTRCAPLSRCVRTQVLLTRRLPRVQPLPVRLGRGLDHAGPGLARAALQPAARGGGL
jgi:5'-3' exoribonuclease 1